MKSVALIVSSPARVDLERVSELIRILACHGCRIRTADTLTDFFRDYTDRVSFLPEDSYLSDCDIALVLGGDGSVIEAARRTSGMDLPLAGINFGHLGYMTAVDKNHMGRLNEILEGKYTIEERIMLDVSIIRSGEKIPFPFPSLNEIVLSNGPVTKLFSFDLYCNGIKTQTYRSDGIIIATPSGSTAYSLSAGGPVVSPTLDCLILTPLCSHSLHSRPVVLDGDAVLEIKNLSCPTNLLHAISDGRDVFELFPGDSLLIARSALKTKLIRLSDDDFLNTLYRKMSDNNQ